MTISKKSALFLIPGIFIFSFLLFTYFHLSTVSAAQAAACTQQTTNPRVQNGLISTSEITDSKFSSNLGKCVVGNQAPFAPYKIPTYDDLKSLYYTQAKTSTDLKHDSVGTLGALSGNKINLIGNKDHLYHITGSVTLSDGNDVNGTTAGVVFIDGELTISINEVGKNQAGLVFIVGGNVNIAPSVTRIDAVIISSGYIYTAGSDCNSVSANPLVVNGSLISLNPADNSIKFCRTLTNNNTAAEQVNWQPKYLVILRNLFADTLQKWSEIQ